MPPLSPISPMPPARRLAIATACSLGSHLLLLALVGLFAWRANAYPHVLIPVELTIAQSPQPPSLGPAAAPPSAPKPSPAPATSPTPARRAPSAAAAKPKPAPAPPKLLTAKTGSDRAAPSGRGQQPAGPGGDQQAPAGPTYGPSAVGGPLPVYPKDALDRGLEGATTLSLTIGPDGSLVSVSVAKSSGHQLLDEAAIRTVKKAWAFKPGLSKGQPTAGELTVTFDFSQGKVERE